MSEITLSAISAILLFLLSLYIFFKKRSVNGALFALFLFLIGSIEISDQISLVLQNDFVSYKKVALILESLLPAVMILFSFFYARQYSIKTMSPSKWLLLAGSLIFPLIVYTFSFHELFYGYDNKVLFLGHPGYWFYLGLMFYCVAALVNIEKTFVTSRGIERWKMKYETIGLIILISILILYYSQAVLHTKIKMSLLPVRSGVLICTAMLIGYSNYMRGNNVQISVSRQVFYRSIAVLIVGSYLLFLGLIVKAMRYFGVNINRDLILFIAFFSVMSIFLVLFSEKIRRKAKVFINKNFYANKYDYRREWLRFTKMLSVCQSLSDVKEAVLSSYRETFGISGALLYLYDRKKNKYILALSQYMDGMDTEFPASHLMESYFLKNQRVINPNDGEYIPNKAEHLFIQESGITMLVPLLSNNSIIGIIMFGKKYDRAEYTYEDFDLMKILARHAASTLQNYIITNELAEMREFAAVGNVLSFIIHDLKNNISSLGMMMNNAEVHIDDPKFQKDMLETVSNTVNKMKGLIQKLNDIPEKHRLDREKADINTIVRESVDEFMKMTPDINLSVRGETATVMVAADEMRKTILNLLLNAHEAASKNGNILIETGNSNGMVYCRVEDDGSGIPRDFYENHLFKPFRTTKKKGLGIGLYQCKQIIEAHGGMIDVKSEPGKGSIFTIYLPKANEAKFLNNQ